jgi:hypothetical protein
MHTRARLNAALAALVGSFLAFGCSLGDGEPERVATRLFEVARSTDPAARSAPDLFDTQPTGAARAKLDDVLDELARVEEPWVVAVEPIDGDDRIAVDLEGSTADGGVARYSVHLVRRDGALRVAWIGGPALRWPARATSSRETGLSSSPTEGAERAW